MNDLHNPLSITSNNMRLHLFESSRAYTIQIQSLSVTRHIRFVAQRYSERRTRRRQHQQHVGSHHYRHLVECGFTTDTNSPQHERPKNNITANVIKGHRKKSEIDVFQSQDVFLQTATLGRIVDVDLGIAIDGHSEQPA